MQVMNNHFLSRLLLLTFIWALLFNACNSRFGYWETLFQAELNELCTKHNLPGMTASFVLENGTIVSVASGLADKEYKIQMTPQSRMLAASIGKTFVAATCVALAQNGILNLNSPISVWLSEFNWFDQLPNHNIITIKQLLNHTSGLPDHVYDERFAKALSEKWKSPANPLPPETLIAYILDSEPRHHPGIAWSYSDTGYLLLGLIIERATNKDFYEVVYHYFINPLMLDNTSPSNRIDLEGLASGYLAPDNDFGLPAKTTDTPGILKWHPGIEWTGGGFISNSHDLAKWFSYLFSPTSDFNYIGKEMIGSVPMNSRDSLKSSGLGVFIQKGTPFGITYGHSGWIPGYRSNVQYYPQYDLSVAFQINTDYGFEGDLIQVFDDIKWSLAKIAAQISDK
jgi:D-alanyl-D-alanine carboxypeptidase